MYLNIILFEKRVVSIEIYILISIGIPNLSQRYPNRDPTIIPIEMDTYLVRDNEASQLYLDLLTQIYLNTLSQLSHILSAFYPN